MKTSLGGLFCLLACALPLTASAQEARSTKWVNLRAGPARDYPLVMQLPPGTPLAVEGCTSGFGWCDVIAPENIHGWIYAGNLAYPYQNAEVPILGYGAMIGFPIVTFAIGNYWGEHYRNRPWYGNQTQWAHRAPPRMPGWRGPRPADQGSRPMGGPPGGPGQAHPGGGGRPSEMARPQARDGVGVGARQPGAQGPRGDHSRNEGGGPANGARSQGGGASRNQGRPNGSGRPRD